MPTTRRRTLIRAAAVMSAVIVAAACGPLTAPEPDSADAEFTVEQRDTEDALPVPGTGRPTDNPTLGSQPPTVFEPVGSDAVELDQEPTNGAIISEWTSVLPVGQLGTLQIEVRAQPDAPSDRQLEDWGVLPSTSPSRRSRMAGPVYVVPGELTITVRASNGLRMLDEDDSQVRSIDETLRVPQIGLATNNWNFVATGEGQGQLTVTAEQIVDARGAPTKPPGMLDVDEMQLNLNLEVVTPAPSGGAAAPTAPADDSTSRRTWQAITGVAAVLGVSALFLMWLVSQALERRARLPRIAGALGYLPHKLAEFKNLKGRRD